MCLIVLVTVQVMLDGEHTIDETLKVAMDTWAETFKYMADNGVMFEGILLKPAMVTPGAECPTRATPDQVRLQSVNLLHTEGVLRTRGVPLPRQRPPCH